MIWIAVSALEAAGLLWLYLRWRDAAEHVSALREVAADLRERIGLADKRLDAEVAKREKVEAAYSDLLVKLEARAAKSVERKEDPVVRARNSGDVRRLMEKEFGGRPDAGTN